MTRCKVEVESKDENSVQMRPVYDENPESENGKFFQQHQVGLLIYRL
jgi:hypothetical protein